MEARIGCVFLLLNLISIEGINKLVSNMKDSSHKKFFSETNPHIAYNKETRFRKAKKILSVLDDYYSENLNNLSILDVGCSSGIIDNILSERFERLVGIDIDDKAVSYARDNFESEKLKFFIQNGMEMEFHDEEFDVVLCTHVYEHVQDAFRLMSEIRRVLKIGHQQFFYRESILQEFLATSLNQRQLPVH